jgi:hypothetical protein
VPRIQFDIPFIQKKLEDLKNLNEENKKRGSKFSNYVYGTFKPRWTTDGGEEAIESLERFADVEYNAYIGFIIREIEVIEELIPVLEAMNRAGSQ